MHVISRDKDGQAKFKVEAFAAKTVLSNGVEKSLYKRIHGKAYTLLAEAEDGVTICDFVIPYPVAKIEAIEIINGKLGDSLTFEVYAPNGTTLLNTFGIGVFLDASGYYEQKSQYDADVVQGLIFRIHFTNANDARDIYLNYVLNEVK